MIPFFRLCQHTFRTQLIPESTSTTTSKRLNPFHQIELGRALWLKVKAHTWRDINQQCGPLRKVPFWSWRKRGSLCAEWALRQLMVFHTGKGRRGGWVGVWGLKRPPSTKLSTAVRQQEDDTWEENVVYLRSRSRCPPVWLCEVFPSGWHRLQLRLADDKMFG
jgi:hypothetical protein